MYRRGTLLHKLADGSAPGVNLNAFETVVWRGSPPLF